MLHITIRLEAEPANNDDFGALMRSLVPDAARLVTLRITRDDAEREEVEGGDEEVALTVDQVGDPIAAAPGTYIADES